MRLTRYPSQAISVMVAIVLALAGAVSTAAPGATAQLTQQQASETIGSSTVSYGGPWDGQLIPGNPPQLMLLHQDLPDTFYAFTEADFAIDEEASQLAALFAEGFFTEVGDGTDQLITVGGTTSIVDNVETRLSWQLHTAEIGGSTLGVLVVANTFSKPGTSMFSVVVAPPDHFAQAVQDVLDHVVIDGGGSPLVGMDSQDIAEDLGDAPLDATQPAATAAATETGGLTLPPLNPTDVAGPTTEATQSGGLTLPPLNPTEAAPTQAPVAPTAEPTAGAGGLTLPPLNPTEPAAPTQAPLEPTAAATTGTGGLTLPPLNPTETPLDATATSGLTLPPTSTPATGQLAGATAEVAGIEVRYTDAWVLDDVNSEPGELLFLDIAGGALQFYGLITSEDTGLRADAELDFMENFYFENIELADVQELEVQEPAPGVAWSLHSGVLGGMPVQVLILIELPDGEGPVAYHWLVSDPGGMGTLLTTAQGTIQIDGEPAFGDVDASLVTQHGGSTP